MLWLWSALSLSACSEKGAPDSTLDDPPPNAVPYPDEARTPNLIVISIDTLSALRVGRYAGTDSTPFLDGLMEDGLTLDGHRSCSNWTYPSITCALSGADFLELGFIPDINDGSYTPVPHDVVLMAEYIEQQGYQTAVVTGNNFIGENFHTDEGYQLYESVGDVPAGEIFEKGLKKLDRLIEAGEPWMLHLHMMDPHSPYDPPEEYLTELAELDPITWDPTDQGSLQKLEHNWGALPGEEKELVLQHLDVRYRGEIRYLDDQLREFFSQLGLRGLLSDTVFMFWSDHGEQFFEHGALGHGREIYDEENRTLAFFWGAGVPTQAWEAPTAHPDLLPTLFELMAWERPAAFSGLPAGQASEGRVVYGLEWRDDLSLLSAVDGDRKVIYRWMGGWEYYRLDQDPAERHDLGPGTGWADLEDLLQERANRIYRNFFPDADPPG